MVIFQDSPDKLDFIAAKDDGRGGENWCFKVCKAPVK